MSPVTHMPAGTPKGGQFASAKGGGGGGGGLVGSSHKELLENSEPLNAEQQASADSWRDGTMHRLVGSELRLTEEEFDPWENLGTVEGVSEGQVKGVIKGLDSAFDAQKPLAQDIEVHRGLKLGQMDEAFYDMTPEAAAKDFVNTFQTMQDNSFVATSGSQREASKFSQNDAHAVVLRIKVPKGAKVLPIESSKALSHAGEQEILLPRSTKIRLVKVSGRSPHLDRAFVIDAEVVL